MSAIIKRSLFPFVSTLCFILTLTSFSCSQEAVEEATDEYPHPGARSSEFVDGPYVFYAGEMVQILTSSEIDGKMVVSMSESDRSELSTVSVYKAGFLPRVFEVKLKTEIKSPPSVYGGSDSIFAVSDIEGNFNTLINLMQQHGVIDEHLNWSYGSGHFVLVGDVFDRGNHVTEMLWFLYGLEDQALAQNGFVHYLMGNHDAMNLRGDLRYLEPKYTSFSEVADSLYGLDYSDLYSEDSELGQWLRTKNVVEKIGNELFVHAGISPLMAESGYSLEEINQLARVTIATPKPEFTKTDSLMWGISGPFWYRGYFEVNEDSWGPRASQADVELALKTVGVEHIIVGHTHVERPEFRYDGRICAINVLPPADHLIYVPPMPAYGTIILDGSFFVGDENGQLHELVDQDS